jgi:hypothetical protein
LPKSTSSFASSSSLNAVQQERNSLSQCSC